MRVVIQRVKSASVSVEGRLISSIGTGLFILLGIGEKDEKESAVELARKVFKTRLMSDKDGKINLTVNDVNGEFLVVSQFTLYGDITGGNRPSFVTAARPEKALPLYEEFIATLESLGATVKKGSFGDHMSIAAEIDGPVTLLVEK